MTRTTTRSQRSTVEWPRCTLEGDKLPIYFLIASLRPPIRLLLRLMDRVLEGVCGTDDELAFKSSLDSELNLIHALELRSELDECHRIRAIEFDALCSEVTASLILRGELNGTADWQVDSRLLGSDAAAEVKALEVKGLHI